MALNHVKMRRIKDKYFREPGLNITRQWDGVEDLQTYLDAMGCAIGTAVEIRAKEADYDAFMATAPDRQKDAMIDEFFDDPINVALWKALNAGDFVPNSGYTLPQLKSIIKPYL